MWNRWSRIVTAGLVSLGLLATVGVAQNPPTIKEREKNQQKRIRKGVKDGELTRREAVKLEAKEAKLHKEIKDARQDGPGITPRERAKITRKQNKLSKEIYKDKHDSQKRK